MRCRVLLGVIVRSSEEKMCEYIVRNNLVLIMTTETGVKHITTNQKFDCLAQLPKKLMNQKDPSRWKNVDKLQIENIKFTIVGYCEKSYLPITQ